jgi:hypothetical protein
LQSNAFQVALIPGTTRAQLLAEVEHVRSIVEEI